MKILQKLAFENEWGRFLYFSGGASEKFNWHKEVGNTSKEKQNERSDFYAKLGKEKQELKTEVGFVFKTNTLLSIQLAEFFGESSKEWSVKNHKKTFDALNRLTQLGYNVDRPSEFKGLKLVIEDSEMTLVNSASGEKVEKKTEKNEQKKGEKGDEEKKTGVDADLDKKTNTNGNKEIVDPIVNPDTKKGEDEKIVPQDTQKTGEGSEIINDNKVVVDDSAVIIPSVENMPKDQSTGEVPVENQEPENMTTQVLGEDFLTEFSTAEKERTKREPKMKELKKTPEQIASLNIQLQSLDQDFSLTRAQLQKALEGHFEKGKLEGKTPAEMELLLKENKKYEQLYSGLKNYFDHCRQLEKIIKSLKATLAVDALYDEEKGYKSRYDVKEEDVLDVDTEKKTEFGKKYESAQQAMESLEKGIVLDNQEIFIEMKEGYERAHLVARAKKDMKELSPIDTPSADDYDKIVNEKDGIKSIINKARTHGVVNDLFAEGELETLLKQERRSSHMKVKENVEKAYKEFPEKYKGENTANLTEKELKNDTKEMASLITILSTGMTKHLNEGTHRVQDEKDNIYWEGKYLDQATADSIEKLLLRKTQLDTSLQVAGLFDTIVSNRNFLTQGRKVGTDSRWLSLENVGQFLEFEKSFNKVISPYRGDANLLQKDLERQYGKDFVSHLERARKNVKLRMSQPDFETSNYDRVDQKVSIQEKKLQFEVVEESDSKGGSASETVADSSAPIINTSSNENFEPTKIVEPVAKLTILNSEKRNEDLSANEEISPNDYVSPEIHENAAPELLAGKTALELKTKTVKTVLPEKENLTPKMNETEISLDRVISAIEEFWDANGVESLAGQIKSDKLEKTLSLLSIIDDHGEKNLVYTNKKGEMSPIDVKNPQNVLDNLKYIIDVNDTKAITLFENRTLARMEKSTDNSNQLWIDILPELSSDVRLISGRNGKLKFERKRKEQVGKNASTLTTIFEINVSGNGEYVIDKVISIKGKDVLNTERSDKEVSRESLIRKLNGESLKNEELITARKKGVLKRVADLGGTELDDTLKIRNEKFRTIDNENDIPWMTPDPAIYWREARHKGQRVRFGISIIDPFEYVVFDGAKEMKLHTVEDIRTHIQNEIKKIDAIKQKERENN